MKKAGSIVFQLNASDFESKGKADRLLTFYKQLLRTRRLARFCKEAFIEKAERNMSGLEEQYAQIYSLIQSKGPQYILEAVKEKETQNQWTVNQAEIDKAVNQILQALTNRLHHEQELSAPVNIQSLTPPTKHKPDMEKLMALL